MHLNHTWSLSSRSGCCPRQVPYSPTVAKVGHVARLQGKTGLRPGHEYLLKGCRHTPRRWRSQTAALPDEAPPWTPDQLAGLAFGAFLLLAVYLAKQVDVIIARSQRKELGLCEECGGLFDPENCPEWRCPKRSEK